MKINYPKIRMTGYALALMLNIFPSYSVSVWFTSMFIQPRFFSFPFLFFDSFKFRLNKWNVLLILNIFVTMFTPLIGYFFDRQFNLLDFAYILSAFYAFLFVNATVKSESNIELFNRFLNVTLILNASYVVLQLILYYSGQGHLTMMHSNIPFHEISGYSIEPGVLVNIPRYTGLFIESGPLTFFLCLSFLYLLQDEVRFSSGIKTAVFMLILFSQSKFLLAFIPVFLLEKAIMRYFRTFYKFSIHPIVFASMAAVGAVLIFLFIFAEFSFGEFLSQNIPAYQLRLDSMKASLRALADMAPFGHGLLGTNYDTPDAKFELSGIDIFSVVLSGYGLGMGLLMISTFLLFPILANIKYKYTYCVILVMGFLSSGSLLVPQYLFALIYPMATHYQKLHGKHARQAEAVT